MASADSFTGYHVVECPYGDKCGLCATFKKCSCGAGGLRFDEECETSGYNDDDFFLQEDEGYEVRYKDRYYLPSRVCNCYGEARPAPFSGSTLSIGQGSEPCTVGYHYDRCWMSARRSIDYTPQCFKCDCFPSSDHIQLDYGLYSIPGPGIKNGDTIIATSSKGLSIRLEHFCLACCHFAKAYFLNPDGTVEKQMAVSDVVQLF